MEQEIIINLQKAGNKILDVIFSAESYVASWIGAIFVFLAVILFLNKKLGFSFGLGFLASIGINYLLKIIIHKPRPYIANSLIENKLQTIGYSFPSGHMVSATFMVLFIWLVFILQNKKGKFSIYNKLWFKISYWALGVVFIIFTLIGRMYLGQHYLTDCLMGIVVGALGFIVTILIYKKLFNNAKKYTK